VDKFRCNTQLQADTCGTYLRQKSRKAEFQKIKQGQDDPKDVDAKPLTTAEIDHMISLLTRMKSSMQKGKT